jgi:hypothetical protein
MMIKGLNPSLPERGKIKIGRKGKMVQSQRGTSFQPPQKLDHFVITTLDREPAPDNNFKRDAAAHERLGATPTELPIRLLYDDPMLNFPTRYANYIGRKLWCTGDGETAQRLQKDGSHHEIRCPCHLADPAYSPERGEPPRCKMNGSLSVLLEGAGGVGGVWKFRTTSYNSIVGILSSLAFLRSITGGVLSNIPLRLYVRPKQGAAPDGSPVTVYIVGIEFAGDIAELQSMGHRIALDRAKTHLSIRHIEDEARQLLLSAPRDVPLPGDTTEDVVEEFYPEQIVTEPPPKPTRADFQGAGDQEPQPEPYSIIDADGVEHSYGDAGDVAAALTEILAAAPTRAALEGIWESNSLSGQLRDRGHAPTADALQQAYVAADKAFNVQALPTLPPSPLAAKKGQVDAAWLAWERAVAQRLETMPQAAIAEFLSEHGKEFDAMASLRRTSWAAVEALIDRRSQGAS